MPDTLQIKPGLAIPLDEIELRTSRSSGPGRSARQRHRVAGRGGRSTWARAPRSSEAQKARISAKLGPRVTASAQDTRSQHRNRELALERLAGRLAHALEVRRPRTKTRPTRASQKRRVDSKKRRGETKRTRRRPDLD